jgi:hypothetical protein
MPNVGYDEEQDFGSGKRAMIVRRDEEHDAGYPG